MRSQSKNQLMEPQFSVCDLKMELKQRKLPVSGSKPQLIERLKPFVESLSDKVLSIPNGYLEHALIEVPTAMSTDDSSSNKSFNALTDEIINSPRSHPPHESEQNDSPGGPSTLHQF